MLDARMGEETINTASYKDRVLLVCMAKKQVGPELVKLKSLIVKTAESNAEDIDILVDVSKVEESDEDANAVAKTFFEGLPFRRMAVYGGSHVVNVGIRLILNLFISKGVGEVKFFKTEEKARQWIKSGK